EVLVVDATQEGTRDLTLLLTLSKQNSWNMQLARNDFESAVALGRIHLVRCLLDAGIDVQHWIGDRSGAYVLALACVHRQAQVAALLLEYDADIECRGTDGMTPLLKTCRTGDDSILDLLLRRRANAGAQTGRGVSAVMLASEQGHVEVVRMLLHFRVNVNRRSADNTTPLMYACVNGHARVVGYLLEARAVVNERGHGMTALICAAKASTCSYPYNLKKYGNVRLPAREDRVECAKAAVQKFCSGGSHGQSRSNCTDDRTGNTCLTAACTLGYAEVTGLLLEASACANMRGPGGCKPLLCAIFEGQADIASLLLEAGACINSRAPHSSRTALTVSLLHGHTDIVRLLQDDRWEINTDSEGVGDEEDCEVD
ncbi:Ank2, partial [Symbiodinium pilosum]